MARKLLVWLFLILANAAAFAFFFNSRFHVVATISVRARVNIPYFVYPNFYAALSPLHTMQTTSDLTKTKLLFTSGRLAS